MSTHIARFTLNGAVLYQKTYGKGPYWELVYPNGLVRTFPRFDAAMNYFNGMQEKLNGEINKQVT